MGWIKSYSSTIIGVTTIRKAFEQYAADYGITVLADEAAALGKPTVTCIIVAGISFSLKLTPRTGTAS